MYRIFIFFLLFISCNPNTKITLKGTEFGTSYSVQYFENSQLDFSNQLDSLFTVINNSMSTYIDTSIISKINNNKLIEPDQHFISVFNTSKEIYKATNGKFDPSVGLLVNYWGFGPMYINKPIDSLELDRLNSLIGFEKFAIDGLNRVIRPYDSFLDFNAIAKGYTVDLISIFLEENDVNNYLVEIGGEIRVKGSNLSKNSPWIIGIDSPNYDLSRDIYATTELKNTAMATSGVYRKYKVDSNGNKYSHILDPKKGIPSKTNILSVSVISNTCVVADALATALHVMNINEIDLFLEENKHILAYIIYEDENGKIVDRTYNNFIIR
tara:strand:+ start:1986 stop:2960 length:975 start_codon:yes stop_codon:yes gene_type:complete